VGKEKNQKRISRIPKARFCEGQAVQPVEVPIYPLGTDAPPVEVMQIYHIADTYFLQSSGAWVITLEGLEGEFFERDFEEPPDQI
jgi:hypothetical protein